MYIICFSTLIVVSLRTRSVDIGRILRVRLHVKRLSNANYATSQTGTSVTWKLDQIPLIF